MSAQEGIDPNVLECATPPLLVKLGELGCELDASETAGLSAGIAFRLGAFIDATADLPPDTVIYVHHDGNDRRPAANAEPGPRSVFAGGGVIIDRSALRFIIEGRLVVMPPKERKVLTFLADNAGVVKSREEIFQAVWGMELMDTTSNCVNVTVSRIRRQLGSRLSGLIETAFEEGYWVNGEFVPKPREDE